MIVPQYWAEGRVQQRDGGRQFTVRRFGWSDLSQEDAQRNADARAAAALQRLLSGEKLERRERRVPYNGAAGVPIREEILARHGDAVITRNAYGAHCLNTPDVLFVDIDYRPKAHPALLVMLALCCFVAMVLAWQRYSGLVLFLALLAIVTAGVLLSRLVRRRHQRNEPAAAHARIRHFSAQHPSWGLRVYRTPGGLRVLVTHALFQPDAPEVSDCFAALGADRLYVDMCRNQRCFRARLSGKPWRMGITTHMKPRPGVWPVSAEQLPRREQWTRHYDQIAAGYAACTYLESLGAGVIAAAVAPVLELHDSACRAHQALPLA